MPDANNFRKKASQSFAPQTFQQISSNRKDSSQNEETKEPQRKNTIDSIQTSERSFPVVEEEDFGVANTAMT